MVGVSPPKNHLVSLVVPLLLSGLVSVGTKLVNYEPQYMTPVDVIDYFRTFLSQASSLDSANEEHYYPETYAEDLYKNIDTLLPPELFSEWLTKTKSITDSNKLTSYGDSINDQCADSTVFNQTLDGILRALKQDKSSITTYLNNWHLNNQKTPASRLCNRFKGLTCQFKITVSSDTDQRSVLASTDPTCQCDGDPNDAGFYKEEPYPEGCYVHPWRPCSHLSAVDGEYHDYHNELESQWRVLAQVAFPVGRTLRCKQGTYCYDLVPGLRRPVCWCTENNTRDTECLKEVPRIGSRELNNLRKDFTRLVILETDEETECNPEFNEDLRKLRKEEINVPENAEVLKKIVEGKAENRRICDFRKGLTCDPKTKTCIPELHVRRRRNLERSAHLAAVDCSLDQIAHTPECQWECITNICPDCSQPSMKTHPICCQGRRGISMFNCPDCTNVTNAETRYCQVCVTSNHPMCPNCNTDISGHPLCCQQDPAHTGCPTPPLPPDCTLDRNMALPECQKCVTDPTPPPGCPDCSVDPTAPLCCQKDETSDPICGRSCKDLQYQAERHCQACVNFPQAHSTCPDCATETTLLPICCEEKPSYHPDCPPIICTQDKNAHDDRCNTCGQNDCPNCATTGDHPLCCQSEGVTPTCPDCMEGANANSRSCQACINSVKAHSTCPDCTDLANANHPICLTCDTTPGAGNCPDCTATPAPLVCCQKDSTLPGCPAPPSPPGATTPAPDPPMGSSSTTTTTPMPPVAPPMGSSSTTTTTPMPPIAPPKPRPKPFPPLEPVGPDEPFVSSMPLYLDEACARDDDMCDKSFYLQCQLRDDEMLATCRCLEGLVSSSSEKPCAIRFNHLCKGDAKPLPNGYTHLNLPPCEDDGDCVRINGLLYCRPSEETDYPMFVSPAKARREIARKSGSSRRIAAGTQLTFEFLLAIIISTSIWRN